MNPIRSLAALAALAVVALAPSAASAQETLTACYVPKSGTVYRIQVAGTPTKCAQNHVQFTWETSGTTSTPNVIEGEAISVDPIQPGAMLEQHLNCPSGTIPVGGAWYLYSPTLQVIANDQSIQVPSGWLFRIKNTAEQGSSPAGALLKVRCLAFE
jgi:hypothetical protein